MALTKILVVDDDLNICEILRLYLVHEGFNVILANNGSDGLNQFRAENPDLVILDLMLPLINGMEVCKLIRSQSDTPILMITARDTIDDKVNGLDTGADDYVVKPFDPKEVVARVRALLRRQKAGRKDGRSDKVISLGSVEIDLNRYTVMKDGIKIDLKPKEIQLLEFFARNPNRVFTREQLLEHVWGYDYAGETRTVDVHIKRIREKLEDQASLWRLSTVWGVGYKLEVD